MNTSIEPELLRLLCATHTPDSMAALLRALLTDSELHDMQTRLRIFNRLSAGTTQRDIAAELGVGIATVTRGAQAIKRGQWPPHPSQLEPNHD